MIIILKKENGNTDNYGKPKQSKLTQGNVVSMGNWLSYQYGPSLCTCSNF